MAPPLRITVPSSASTSSNQVGMGGGTAYSTMAQTEQNSYLDSWNMPNESGNSDPIYSADAYVSEPHLLASFSPHTSTVGPLSRSRGAPLVSSASGSNLASRSNSIAPPTRGDVFPGPGPSRQQSVVPPAAGTSTSEVSPSASHTHETNGAAQSHTQGIDPAVTQLHCSPDGLTLPIITNPQSQVSTSISMAPKAKEKARTSQGRDKPGGSKASSGRTRDLAEPANPVNQIADPVTRPDAPRENVRASTRVTRRRVAVSTPQVESNEDHAILDGLSSLSGSDDYQEEAHTSTKKKKRPKKADSTRAYSSRIPIATLP